MKKQLLLLVSIFLLFSSTRSVAQLGSMLTYDGGNYVNIPSVSFGTNWSAEVWIYPTNTSSPFWQVVMGQAYWGNNQGFVMVVNSNTLFVDGPQGFYIQTTISANNWYHLAVTYDHGDFKLYKNGLLTGISTNTNYASSTLPFYLGKRNDNSNSSMIDGFNGYMDEVRIWNTTRTECQIQQYMNCEIPSNATGLFANYHFNEGIGGAANTGVTTLNDATSNAWDGTLNGFALTLLSTSNWALGSVILNGYSLSTAVSPSISVTGNGTLIANGDLTPSFSDNTIYGNTTPRTFVIQNTGSTQLTPTVFVTGPNAANFSITTGPTASVAATSGTTSFQMTFLANTAGVNTATIMVFSNDCSTPAYSFAVQATTADALIFDGVDDYVDLGTNSLLKPTAGLTAEAWVWATSWSSVGTFLSNANGGGFEIRNTGTNVRGMVYRNGSYATIDIPVAGISAGPHHFALTYDGRYTSLFMDGVLKGTDDAGANYPITYSANNTFLGSEASTNSTPTPGYYYNGRLDEVRVWNTARTQCQIQSYMNCEIPANATGLNVNYHFNQGLPAGINTGYNTLKDLTSNNVPGTLYNFNLSTNNGTSNWVGTGGVVTNYTVASVPNAVIDVKGSAVSISNNATSTSTTNGTSYTSAGSHTFVIDNLTISTLNIGKPTIDGANASEFSVTVIPSSSVTTGTTSFVVAFTPTAAGTRSATIRIISNDCSKPVFNFVVQGAAGPGEALNFDGSDDYVAINHNSLQLLGTNFSFEAWVNPSLSGNNTIISKGGGNGSGGNGDYIFQLDATNHPSFYYGALNTWKYSGSTVPLNAWSHVAVTCDGAQMKFYINGVPAGNAAITTPTVNAGTGPMYVARQGSACACNYFNGSLDEVRMWSTTRSGCEIISYMSCEIPASAAGLVANYHFNQGSAGVNNTMTSLFDNSGNSLNGTLTNFALTGTISNWIAPGAVPTNYTLIAQPATTLTVKGNGIAIPNGNTGVSLSDLTDYGQVTAATAHTFVLQTSGTGSLYISYGMLTGANASNFAITTIPSTLIPAGGSGSVVVTYTPTSMSTQSAVLNIYTSDCSGAQYSFVLSGSASPASALNFDGADDAVNCGIPVALANQPLTVEFWAKRAANSGFNTVFSLGSASANNFLHAAFPNGTSTFRFSFFSNDLTVNAAGASDGLFHHYACVFNPAATGGYNRFIYIDGILAGQDNSASNFVGSGPLNLGKLNGSADLFMGSLDEFRIWNVARSQCEIQTYMNAEIPTSASNLLINYHFNQGIPAGSNSAETTLLDAAGSNNGTLTAFALTGSVSNWVIPGGVANGYTIISAPAASLQAQGNGNTIAYGATATATNNFTDFGSAYTRTFVITNAAASAGTLSINSVSISGANASAFSITAMPSLTAGLAMSASGSLVIAFTPTSIGSYSAIVTLVSNDCAHPTFSFVISSSVTPASALNFDGVNDYVQLNDPVFGTGDFTLETWFKVNNLNSGYIFSTRTSEAFGAGNWWNLGTSGGDIGFEMGNNIFASSGYFYTANTPITAGNWYHVALVRSGTLFKMYINGVMQASYNDIGVRNLNTGANSLRLGGWPNYGLAFLNGSLDEVRIWNVARTPCDIQTYMNCEIPGTATGLLYNYHFNQGIPSGLNTAVTTVTSAAGVNTGSLTNFALNGSSSNWISPGGVANNYTFTSIPTASLQVLGNGNNIAYGSTGTSTNNFTDFGAASTRTFAVSNAAVSASTLYINSVTLSGANASEFSVTAAPSSTNGFATSATSSFVIAFTPTALGTRSAVVTLGSNDCAHPTFSFVISASATPASALNFDGTDDYVSINYVQPATEITNEFWFKTTNSNQSLFCVTDAASTVAVSAWDRNIYLTSGDLYAYLWLGGPGQTINTSGTNYADGNWHHVAHVIGASQGGQQLYVDGILRASGSATASSFNSNTNITLGYGPLSGPYNGSIDEVRLWTVARTQCDIQTYMNAEITGSVTGLAANYHFNQGIPSGSNTAVTTVTDAAGSNTGSLQNFALNGSTSNWISPGAVANGYTTTTVSGAALLITGNGITISAGSVATSTNNFTDFGSVFTRTFVTKNAVSGLLYIDAVKLSGVNANDFSITAVPIPSSGIAANASASFAISFNPSAIGTRSAIVIVSSNDCSVPSYSFAISGIGNAASALDFDGVDDYVSVSPGVNLNNKSFTVEFWTERTNINGYGIVVGQGTSVSTNQSLHIGFRDIILGSPFTFAFYSNDLSYTTTATTDGQPHHWACVYDNSLSGINRFIYLDGVLVASDHSSSDLQASGPLIIGDAGYTGNLYKGWVDDLRIWNMARTQCDIQTYMNCEIPASSPSLIANYHFNQGVPGSNNSSFTTLTDLSGNNNNGTLNNFALTGGSSNWISPGEIANGYTVTSAPAASLQVFGNSSSVAYGATATSTNNFTDFGAAYTRTFVAQNSAAVSSTLYIDGITLSGANAADFSITVAPSATNGIAMSASANFVIAFTPTTIGTSTAVVSVRSNDCTHPTYSFVISATQTAASALSFDGVDDYVQLSEPNLGTGDFTIETWFKATSLPGNSYLLSTRTSEGGGTGNYWDLAIHNMSGSYLPYFETASSGTVAYVNLAPATSFNLNTWNHLAVVRSGSTLGMYMNGTLLASMTTTGIASLYTTNHSLRMSGSGAGLALFNGLLDETRIWTVARTQCEIQTYMNCEIPGNPAGLLYNYHLNQGIPSGSNVAVTTATSAATSNNGTLNGFTLNGGTSNWVSPGAVPNDYTVTSAPTASIQIQGNSSIIANGSTITGTNNFTDFGNTGTRTFVIQNAAASGTLYPGTVTLIGADAASFSVTTQPISTAGLTTGGTTNFVITFSPTSLGSSSAIVNVSSNDCSTPNYSFVISASVSPASALNFDGSDDYIQRTDFTLGTGDLTLEAWIKPQDLTTIQHLIHNRTNETTAAGNWFYMGISNSGQLTYEMAASGNSLNTSAYITSANTLTQGAWQHIAAVRSGQQITLYINGIMNGTFTDPFVRNLTNASNTGQIGGNHNALSAWFNGSMDEVRVWNVARTQCDIQTYMNCEIPATAAGLIANYHFNQGIPAGPNATVTTLTDATGANNGTLNNFALSGASSNWVAPGGVANGYTTTLAVSPASLQVQGNSNTVAYGATATSTNNFTDFGSATSRIFAATNAAGSGTLYVSTVLLSGGNASDFSVTTQPATTPLASGASVNFAISFSPTAIGTRSAVVTVVSSDCSHPTYSFVISSSVTPASALNFDGANDYVAGPVISTGNTNLTLQAKVNLSSVSTTTNSIIVYNGNSSNSGYGLVLTPNSPEVYFLYGGIAIIPTGYILPFGQWTDLSMVIDNTNTTRLYANGLSVFSSTATIPYVPTTSLTMGGNIWGTENMQGNIDEVRIWTKALSQCEILTYLNCEIPTTAANLAANYHFNQGVPSGPNTAVITLTDAAGSHNETLYNFALNGSTSNWIAPGAVPNGYTVTSASAASLAVTGNGNAVNNGAASTSTNNLTDFGSATTRTFVTTNAVGSSTLYVNQVTLSGANASDFSITAFPSPSLPITTGVSGSVVINFSPTAIGTRSAIVTIAGSDCSAPNYSFVITGSVSTASALDLDGTDDFVNIASSNMPSGNGDYTVEFWTKIKGAQSGHRWIAFWGVASVSGSMVSIGYDGSAGNKIRIHHFGPDLSAATAAIPTGVWTHVAVTYHGATNTNDIYINGNYIESLSFGTPLTIPASPQMQLGTFTSLGTYASNIVLDEVRTWGVVRSQCDIQTYMNAEIPSTASGLLANYHFNQGIPSGPNATVTTLTDATGNNSAALNNFSLSGSTSNWVIPGAMANGYTVTASIAAGFSLTGNGSNITFGSVATSTANNTDFGTNASRTFSIYNAGTGTLNINTITLTGPNAAQFNVTSAPATSVTTGTTGFAITLTPTNTGISTATVNISSNDCTHPTFSFVITGSTTPASALNFDGSNDYVILPNASSSFSQGLVTVEGWINANSYSIFNSIIKNWGDLTSVGAFHFGTDGVNGNRLQAVIAQANSTQIFAEDPAGMITGTWYHVAMVADGAKLHLYKNGVEVASADYDGTLISSFPYTFIGVKPGNTGVPSSSAPGWWNGSMDEIRVWNVARSQCDIQSFMSCEIPSGAAGLIYYYHFNEGVPSGPNTAVTSLTDAAASHTGTLTNFALNGSSSNWISPGGVANGYTTSVAPTASISVSGNSQPIANNATSTSTLNFTDFNGALTRTFVIGNAAGTLNVSSLFITGANASDFSITTQPSGAVTGGGSTSFVVAFTPTASGVKTATVNMFTNDCNTPLFSFAIKGTPPAAQALNFDGVNDDLSIPHSASYSFSTAITLEAWIKTTNSGEQYITTKHDDTWYLAVNGGGTVSGKASFYVNGPSTSWLYGSSNVSDGNWHHLAGVYDGSFMRLYVDGALENVAAASGTLQQGTNPAMIGSRIGTYFFNGSIDEVRIWNTARTQCEIQSYMSCEIPASATGLLGNYHFNQGSAGIANPTTTTLIDASGYSNNGTLSNFALNGPTSNWIAPSAVTSGFTTVATPSVEIDIQGNGISIADGNLTPGSANNTDMGAGCLGAGVTKTFAILNTGTQPLTVASLSLTGVNASEFVLSTTASSTITASGSQTFAVTFTPATMGTKNATVNIISNDCDEALYYFAITGSVSPTPSISVPAGTICLGQSFTLNPTGASTYSYAPAGPAVNPTVTTTYSVTGTSTAGCVSGTTVTTITVNSIPSLSIAATGGGTICSGATTTLSASGAITYTWSNSLNTSTIAVSSASNTTYSVSGTGANGCISNTTQLISINPLPTVNISNTSVCPGNSLTLNPTGASTYTYYDGTGTISAVVTPTGNTSYSITGTSAQGCISSTSAIVTVSVINTVTVSVSGSTTICNGQTTTLTAGGATSYTWTSGDLTAAAALSPTTATSYTVYGASGTCSNTAVVTVTVNNTPTITVNSGTICAGTVFTMTPGGASTYTFSSGNNTVSPASTTTFAVIGTNSLGCVSTSAATASVTVNSAPSLTITPGSASVCSGFSTTLTASGANSYTWASSMGNNSTVAVTPTPGTTYTLSGTGANGCTSSTTQVIAVNPLPTVNISNTSICPGNSYTLNPTGAATYTYYNSTGTISAVITPTNTSTYSITGTSSLGCVSSTSAVVTVSVINTLTVSVTGNTTICNGQTTTLTANGATSYTWTSGDLTAVAALSPSTITSYTVYGVSGTCSNNAVVSVSVNATPTITVNSGSICAGSVFTMTPGGASTYTFSSGTNTVSPAATSTFAVIGSSLGCVSTSSAIASVTVNAAPSVSIAAANTTICSGASVPLTASGAGTYTWSASLGNNANVNVAPASTTSYSVAGTGTNGCVGTSSVTITANPLPTVSISNATICPGNSYTFTPGGANTYTYSSGGNTVSSVVTPVNTTTYAVTGTSSLGCVALTATTTTVSVINTVTVAVTGNTVICDGQTTTLTASGATNYTWTSSALTASTALTPSTTTTYTVYGASGTCSNNAIVTVSVNATPTITVNNGTVCAGTVFTMIPGGAGTYTYSSGSNTVTPVTSTTFAVIGTSTAGCVSTASAISNVSVNALPVLAISSPSDVCDGTTASLTVSGASTYTWSNALGNATLITVTPASGSNSFSVSGTNANGCVGTATQSIFIDPLPTITIASGAICPGNSFTLSPSGASTYTFSGGSNVVSPVLTSTYSVAGTSSAGCVSPTLAVATVSVVHNLNITVSGNRTLCSGESTSLTAGGAATYSWSSGQTTDTVVLTPSVTTDYTVTGASGTCSDIAVVSITVNLSPTVSVSNGTVCAGMPFVLTPTGAISYTYSSGSPVVTPTSTSTYSIVGSDVHGCVSGNTAVATVSTIASPTLIAAVTDSMVCSGVTTSLTVSGATTYTWSTHQSAATIAITPSATTVYTVSGTGSNGCIGSTSITASVSPGVSLTLTQGPHGVICGNDSITLFANGADSYTWTPGVLSGSMITVVPGSTTVYTVHASATGNCSNYASITVTVGARPSLTVSISDSLVCPGTQVTLTANGAYRYTWSTFETTNKIIFAATTNSVYTVTGISSNSCTSTSTIAVKTKVCQDTIKLPIGTYNGITPNGDGVNDTWRIRNIEQYKNNHVTIFNRWGNEVADIKNYDNASNFWPKDSDVSNLQSATYFYVIDLGDGSALKKGFVEVMKE